jgi:hypothetical protein
MKELLEVLDGGPINRSDDEYFCDLYEAAELIEFSGAYARFGDTALSRLRRATKGGVTFRHDSIADGRNVSFELAVAMRADRSNAVVVLPEIGDILIETRNCRFVAECKRPQSLAGLKRNLEKAARQGDKRAKGESDHSVVLADVSVALNPEFRIRRTNLPKESLYRRAHKWLRAFTERDGLRLNGMEDLSHIGILARYSSFGVASGEMFHCQVWAAYPNTRLGEAATTRLRELVELMDPNYVKSSSYIAMF